ncbi:MAG: transcription elongation factor GreA [candidate division Zixibacteria bacterium HGW-Zixibacteria-1]|nr:MAG: transcription elongation factor GreA [candidate division Zixibacteria bacterium HGW-Zixibacteria-1]
MDNQPIFLSREGLLKLEQELKQLKTVERPTIVAEIKRAREMGDLSENAEYHAAKEAQVHIERKIAELEDKLSRVQSINTDNIPSDKAYLFAKVLVKDLDDGEEIEYTLAPQEETDLDNDIISIKSPIGAALLGKAVGDVLEVKVPAGIIKYEILKISRE